MYRKAHICKEQHFNTCFIVYAIVCLECVDDSGSSGEECRRTGNNGGVQEIQYLDSLHEKASCEYLSQPHG